MTRDSAGICLRLAHPHVGDRSSYRFLTDAFLARFQRKPPRSDRSSSRSSLPRYRDPQHLARGGMGDVYRATDTQLGRTVAIKVLGDRYADDESVRERFKREALAAARLSGSPNTVTIFDVGESDGHPYIVMELLEGGTLEDRLRAGGAQDPADVLRWLEQAAGALDAAHAAGVVHRDVKPGNLLLNSRGEVSVADFGVASAVGLDSMTMTGTVLGTAGYLSPEQAKGERATPASDRYALGVVAYELLTGERPFASRLRDGRGGRPRPRTDPATPSQHGDVPPELDPVLRRALAKDPAERYASSADFVAALREALSHAAGTTRALAAVGEEEYTPVAAPPRRAASTRLGGCGDPRALGARRRPRHGGCPRRRGRAADPHGGRDAGDDAGGPADDRPRDGHDGSGDDERADHGHHRRLPPTRAARR